MILIELKEVYLLKQYLKQNIKFSFFDETERAETIFDLEKILKSCLKPIPLEELIKEVQEHYKRNILEAYV